MIIKGNAKTKISIKIFGNALTYSSKGMIRYNKIKTYGYIAANSILTY